MSPVTDITHLASIQAPAALRELKAWVIWRFEPNDNPGGKPRKVPYYAAGGRRYGDMGTPEDRRQLCTFDQARTAAAKRGMDGVGFAPLADHGIVALDFDDCVDDAGEIHPEVQAILGTTYAELSPSGHGVRAFFRGQLGNRKSHHTRNHQRVHPFGMETFSNNGFVTFTGNVLPLVEILGNEDAVAPVDQPVLDLFARRFSRDLDREQAAASSEPLDRLGLSRAEIDQALASLPDDLDYDTWLMVGMALHHETGGEGFDIWDEWSSRSPKYTSREYGWDRWRSFDRGTGPVVTARSLIHLANENGAGMGPGQAASLADFDVVNVEAQADSGEPKTPRFTPVSVAEFASRPPPQWIIKGVLPKAELVVLFGESGSGKSFVALDMAIAICLGEAWRGRRTRAGRVVYIAAEGAGGFRNRCVALAQHRGLDLADIPLDIVADAPNLLMKPEALALAKAIGRADIVVVDTFAQTTPGGNENAGEDMGKALAHCKGIHRATGAVVILVHHSGKDASKGARGWSGLRAAADAELEVTRTPAGRMLRTSKQKDGDDDLQWGFGLETVTIGMDEDGDPITSCVVVEADIPTAKLIRPMGPVETIVSQVIQEMAQAQNSGIEVGPVLAEAVKRLEPPADGKRDTRKQRCRRALEALTVGDDAPYWIADDGCITVC